MTGRGRQTVWDLLAAARDRWPDSPALSAEGRTWSHSQLLDEVERVGANLLARGLRPGDRVAIYASNNPEVVLTWLACARTGIVVSAINFMFVDRELAWVLGQLEPELVVVDEEHLDAARKAIADAGIDAPLYLIGDEAAEGTERWSALLDAGSSDAGSSDAGAAPAPSDVVEITYTSGTTSKPKGAVFTQAAHAYSISAWNDHFGIDHDTVTYCVTPLFHASGIRNQVLSALIAGGHVHVIRQFHPKTFWQDICDLGVTFFMFVETIMLILEKQEPSELERGHAVRRAVGPGQPDFLKRLRDRFGFETIQIYGMTEVSIATAQPVDLSAEEVDRVRSRYPEANYVGEPIGDETEVRIVDEDGHDVPEGEMGEFRMRTPGQLTEYFEDPEATAATIVDGWVHSGDYGIPGPDGSMYFVDRKKDMIRRSGENLAPKEVEDILMAHDDVLEATVIPVPDPVRVQEVKAIVVRREGSEVGPEELWSFCDERLAKYKVPRYIEFRSSIPRNLTGRALKAQLREEPVEGEGDTYDRTGERAAAGA